MMEYGCIAEKLSHSFSKEIHSKLYDEPYTLREVPKDELDSFMRKKEFKAINVTIPYKGAVIPYLDEISPIAKDIGAVNTIVNRNGKLYGYNTDFMGLAGLIRWASISIADKKVLILGSGGTSKTAYAVANHMGAREAYRVSRSGSDGCITYEEALSRHTDAQILINTTPCGMYPNLGNSAVELNDYPMVEGVVDAVYNPLRSKLICDAMEKGIPAIGGLYMLVAQAVYAVEKFMDITIDPSRIEEIYREIAGSKENIILIGMPGCGKTTVGKALSEALSMELIDTDALIVENTGRQIPDIFAQDGETAFRDLESAAIRETAAKQHCIIATGGGAILRKENMDLLRQNGRIYFIDRPLAALLPTDDRPLSSNRQALEQRYHERYALYCAACDCHITTVDTPEQVFRAIKEDFTHEIAGN